MTTLALDAVRAALPPGRYLDVTSKDRDGEFGYAVAHVGLPSVAVRPQTAEEVARVLDAARAGAKQKLGFAERTRAMGATIAEQLGTGAARAKRVEALALHRSDTVRGWCA